MFESFQLEGLFVTDLLHSCSVNVCSEWTRKEHKELPVVSILACIMATLNRNSIEHNWGLVYGNNAASDRGPGFQNVAQEPWLFEKSQECKLGGKQFSLFMWKTWQISSGFVCSYWAVFRGAVSVAQYEQREENEPWKSNMCPRSSIPSIEEM